MGSQERQRPEEDRITGSRSLARIGKPILFLIVAVYACSVYANLSLVVQNSADYRFFPPFLRHVNANHNHYLGGESFNMARSLVAGKRFASPFDYPSGPTAWHPPVLPLMLAAFLGACGGSRDGVMAVVVFLQVLVLIGTGLLVLALARQTARRIGTGVAALLFFAGMLCNFHLCFQETQDYWLVLLTVDLLVAGLCWLQPLREKKAAAGWGLFGGLCTLINPIVGLTWAVLSLWDGFWQRAWSRLALAVLVAGLTLIPWTVRNYLVFGRVIPVKSNLAFELYQSQCLQPDGLIRNTTFGLHPYGSATREGQEYLLLGETAYLERKRQQFRQAVSADPADFLRRVTDRLLGATLWYVPFDRAEEARQPWACWLSRLTYPLPFLALLVLAVSAIWQPLCRSQMLVIAVYLLYLLPYVVISYYERYAVPLLGVKVLLVIWAGDRLLALLPSSSSPETVHSATGP
jgi:hypothetical protein